MKYCLFLLTLLCCGSDLTTPVSVLPKSDHTASGIVQLYDQNKSMFQSLRFESLTFAADNSFTIGTAAVRAGNIEANRLITRAASSSNQLWLFSGSVIQGFDTGANLHLNILNSTGKLDTDGCVGFHVAGTGAVGNSVGFCAPAALTGNTFWSLPTGDTAGCLQSDGLFHLSIASCSGAGSGVAGLDTQIQYNNMGAFGASASLTWNNSSNFLDLANAASIGWKDTGGTRRKMLYLDGGNAFHIGPGDLPSSGTGDLVFAQSGNDRMKLTGFPSGNKIFAPVTAASVWFGDGLAATRWGSANFEQITSWGNGVTAAGRVTIQDATQNFSLAISGSALTTNHVWTLPATQGGANTFLRNDGSGNLSWTSGSTTPCPTCVTTNTAQTITFTKTFSVDQIFNANILMNGGTSRLDIPAVAGAGVHLLAPSGGSLYVGDTGGASARLLQNSISLMQSAGTPYAALTQSLGNGLVVVYDSFGNAYANMLSGSGFFSSNLSGFGTRCLKTDTGTIVVDAGACMTLATTGTYSGTLTVNGGNLVIGSFGNFYNRAFSGTLSSLSGSCSGVADGWTAITTSAHLGYVCIGGQVWSFPLSLVP